MYFKIYQDTEKCCGSSVQKQNKTPQNMTLSLSSKMIIHTFKATPVAVMKWVILSLHPTLPRYHFEKVLTILSRCLTKVKGEVSRPQLGPWRFFPLFICGCLHLLFWESYLFFFDFLFTLQALVPAFHSS